MKALPPKPLAPQPQKSDGRDIDEARGVLAGEGSLQQVKSGALEDAHPSPGLSKNIPTAQALAQDPTYYDRAVLKEPLWIWSIPVYFHVGGVAGSAAVLGGMAEVFGGRALSPLARRCAWVTLVGSAASGALLIHDLGRPERFYNMLRVFRPSSPMNVGTWVLTGLGGAATAWVGARLLRRPRLAQAGGWVSAVFGLPMAGYTAVLVTTTAVPVWHQTRRSLPALFVASGAAGLAALFELWPSDEPQSPSQKAARWLGVAARAADLVASDRVQKDVDRVERVGRPLHEGKSGLLWKAAKVLTAASLGLSLFGPRAASARRRRQLEVAAGVAGTAGGLALRFALLHAGRASAKDPRATFHSQRTG